MKEILFVCHGNICRSPMAQMVFSHMAELNGKSGVFFVDSAATDRDAIGCPVHRGTRSVLAKNGIPLIEHYARLATLSDYTKFDLIVCMDCENLRHLERIWGPDSEGKVKRLLEFCGEERDVADPWYTGDFDETFRDVWRGCSALFGKLNGTDGD